MRHSLFLIVVAAAVLGSAHAVHAGGLEYTGGQGAQSLARGGAVVARADDPMVLARNPAGLAELRGTQFLFNANLALLDACFEPAGYYGWGVYNGGKPSRLHLGDQVRDLKLGELDTSGPMPVATEAAYYSDPLDTVCLDQNVVPVPQIIWTKRLSERLGLGFGFVFPGVQPSGRWGGRDGVIKGADGDLRPAATRYMMLSQSNLGIFPNLGLGYRIAKFLRVGLAVEWGVIAVDTYTMAAAVGGTIPANDVIAHIKTQDWFVPGFTASVHVVPTDAIDIVASFHYQDALDSTGDIDLTTGSFDPNGKATTTGGIPITRLHQGMPWKLDVGLRYADRLAPRPTGTGADEADAASAEVVHDALQDERWDIELDAEYQINSNNDQQELAYEGGNTLTFASSNPMSPLSTVEFPAPGFEATVIRKRWKDQLSIRAGSSINIVPGRFAVSAGANYETRGVDPSYMQVDIWPLSRVGVNAGVTVRVAKAIDLVFAYGHIFQETLVVGAPPNGIPVQIMNDRVQTGYATAIDKTVGVATDRAGNGRILLEEKSQGAADGTAKLEQVLTRTAAGQPPSIVNAGRYTSHFNLLALGVNLHF